MNANFLLNLLEFALLMCLSTGDGTKQEWFIKVVNSKTSGNVKETVSVKTVLECAIFCLSNEICSSYNFRRIEGSDVNECEINGANSGSLVASNLTDHFYPKREYHRDCSDHSNYTGVATIHAADGRIVDAYCKDGWLYLSRRFDGSVDFYKTYAEYQSGFGDRYGEYFLGLDNLVSLLKQGDYTLRVDLKMWPPSNTEAYAQYSSFRVANASEGYRLHIEGYSGTAGDSLSNHHGMKFSTKDNDQDQGSRHCATTFQGAGWYNDCQSPNLFGTYNQGPQCPNRATCISWYDWPSTIGNPDNYYYAFKEANIKLKIQT